MKQRVIIDTSAWIDFFGDANGSLGDTVADLISQDRGVLVGPVLAELLQGIRNAKETDLFKTLLTTPPYLKIDRQDWHAAGQILQELRSQGITIPLTDALIGMVAKRNDLRLLTIDRHFEHLPAQLHLFP